MVKIMEKCNQFQQKTFKNIDVIKVKVIETFVNSKKFNSM